MFRNDITVVPADARIIDFSLEETDQWAIDGVGELPADCMQSALSLVCVAQKGSTSLHYEFSWVPQGEFGVSWTHLVEALRAYTSQRHDDMCFAANVAVESALRVVLTRHFGRYFRAQKAREFIRRSDHAVNLRYHLPICATNLKLPRFPESLTASLWRLLELRNEVGHVGALKRAPGDDEARDVIVAASLSLHFCRLLRQREDTP